MNKTAMQVLKCKIQDAIDEMNGELNLYSSGYKQCLINIQNDIDAQMMEMETEQMRRMYVLCHKADFLPPEILEENFQHYYKQILNTPKNPKQ